MTEIRSDSSSSLLAVKGVSKSFGGILAVKDVKFSVEDRHRCAIIGPNGAGKTTLFNLITRRLKPDRGEVYFSGRRIDRFASWKIAQLGLLRTFQITSIFAELSSLTNVQIALFSGDGLRIGLLRPASKAQKEQAEALLEEMGLQGKMRIPAGELSYGDRHRLELAMVLARDPKLVVLDEPGAGLGDRERRQMRDLLMDVCEHRGLSLLFSDHDMDVVFSIADSVVVMDQGQIVAKGTPSEIRENDDVKRIYLGTEVV